MPHILTVPRVTVKAVPCDRCNGTGRRASAWDFIRGLTVVVGRIKCDSCLGTGWVRQNCRADD